MRLLLTVAMTAILSVPANAISVHGFETTRSERIVELAGSIHPAALYVLSSRLLAQGKGQEAANWMYAGQLRYRFMIAALGHKGQEQGILYSAMTEQVGRPVNGYIAGNPDEWIAAMEWALNWDAVTDNAVTSKTEFAAELSQIREGLRKLIARVDASRDQIRKERAANGLPNR